jgi:hypothetical protein
MKKKDLNQLNLLSLRPKILDQYNFLERKLKKIIKSNRQPLYC